MQGLFVAAILAGQAASNAVQAKKEYDTYLETMSKMESVACTLDIGGGFRSARYGVFRCIKGGIYSITASTWEVYCDGKTAFGYNVDLKAQSKGPTGPNSFSVVFGPNLFPLVPDKVEPYRVDDEVVEGTVYRRIYFKSADGDPFILLIAKETGLPFGWSYRSVTNHGHTYIRNALYNIKFDANWIKRSPLGEKDESITVK